MMLAYYTQSYIHPNLHPRTSLSTLSNIRKRRAQQERLARGSVDPHVKASMGDPSLPRASMSYTKMNTPSRAPYLSIHLVPKMATWHQLTLLGALSNRGSVCRNEISESTVLTVTIVL
jgi:hypothetical protein